ncbi:amino acid ABC transporter permease [Butyrivibrio sp. M55]|uniref:amino acid ABC transporter permease n=1 Tax=Butyrivibrio sp. M55 TaxID=1855323 RepID=UPI0008F3C44D|nr:ABC transporter permease subunit [Butyrivibrio sp. M55]SFU84255.1 amino acid ABC transporter membrane protein 2, PAAT family [Butyrivibrio sp. M55]
MEIQFDRVVSSLQSGLSYLGNTLKISVIAILLGTIIALIIALVRFYRIPVLSQVFAFFVTVYRGIPIMLILLIGHLLYVMYFDSVARALHLSVTIKDVDIILLGYIILTIGGIPSISETFRGAMNSIDKTQFEACYSVGLNTSQSLRRIILPQMLPVAFPGYINNILGIVKGIPLLSAVGIMEIMSGALVPCSVSYSYLEGYAATAIIYFVLITIILAASKRIEKYLMRYRVITNE